MRRVATIVTTVYFSLIILPATAFAKGGGSGGRGGGGGSKSGGRSGGYRSGGSSGGHGVSGSSSSYPSFMTWLCLGLVGAVIIGVVVWGIKKKNSTR